MTLGILALNIANPSAARAERQLAWLAERPEQILVLSETGSGPGTRLLLDRLRTTGWTVRSIELGPNERGVAIASRVRVAPPGPALLNFLPERAAVVSLDDLDIVGLYVPSRDESQAKIERKRRFCIALSAFLAERPARDGIVIGDLNVLEPVHRPHHASFLDWEYRLYDEFVVREFVDAYRLLHRREPGHSWIDYEGRGFRFDHAFVTESIANAVTSCDYDNHPREAELSDHSALQLLLDWRRPLEAIELAGPLDRDPMSLF